MAFRYGIDPYDLPVYLGEDEDYRNHCFACGSTEIVSEMGRKGFFCDDCDTPWDAKRAEEERAEHRYEVEQEYWSEGMTKVRWS